MGVVLASSGAGGAAAAPIVSHIITTSGYKTSYTVVAILLSAVGILALLLFRDKPKGSEVGAYQKKHSRGKEWTGISLSEALRKPYFYIVIICIFFSGLLFQGTNTVWQPHLADIGISAEYVSIVLSISNIALAAFKILVGVMYDKFGLRPVASLCIISGATVMVALAIVDNSPMGMALAMFYGIFASLSS